MLELLIGDRVDVYRNTRGDNFSIRKKGKVVQHENVVLIENPKFMVSQAGRNRVLKERRKNVHAVVRGSYVGSHLLNEDEMREAYYNPYTTEGFIDKETKNKLNDATLAYLVNNKIYYS